jgi:hypothetical protein
MLGTILSDVLGKSDYVLLPWSWVHHAHTVAHDHHLSISIVFATVGLILLFWSIELLLVSLFARRSWRVCLFLALCLAGSFIGIEIVAACFAGVEILAHRFFGNFGPLIVYILLIPVLFYLLPRIGAWVTKTLFVRGSSGRALIDNSILFGGWRNKRPRTRK